ncbi:hypothetical protein [Tychonema sp. BBK16]|nr:hypothetical protein [Tychonema sp. BBK16]MCF6372533.1 hypothetical protein [Tychonema sp. BBK16]
MAIIESGTIERSIPFGIAPLHALFPQPLQNRSPIARNTIASTIAYNRN